MSTNMNFNSEWMRGGFSKNVNTFSDSPFEESNMNALKYSKEYMLSLYKPSQLPSDFQHHEYVTVEESLTPLAFDELSELEKKLLSGPVHVEGSRRLIDKRHRMGHDNNSPLAENGPNRFNARKGRDYFSKDSTFRRNNENDLVKKRETVEELSSPFGKPEDEVPWSKNGLFKDEPFKTEFAGDLNTPPPGISKKSEETKWFYRDPSGQVQGPFEAREMQEWYKAGFFSPTLLLRREDESVFEPLLVIIQKVGNEDEPFLAARPAATPDLFGSSDGLFGRNEKYMPFGTPTTPGGSIVDSFLSGSSNTPLYQNPYGFNGGNSLLRDNLWNSNGQTLGSPSWMNHPNTDLFGNAGANPLGATTGALGLSPFIGQQQQQQNMNPMFGSNNSNGSLFDYHRAVNEQMNGQQQYFQMLKQQQQQQQTMQQQQQQQTMQQHQHQQQQQQTMQQQQHQTLQQQAMQHQQQQFQPMLPEQPSQHHQPEPIFEPERIQPVEKVEKPHTNTIGQNTLKSLTLEHINSNHASPVLRTNNILSGGSGWGSAPGTPLASDAPSSPWGTIGASALPSKITDELQPKAPGAQSPRAPSSPKKPAAEKPKLKSVIESFADIQLEEMEKKKEETFKQFKPEPEVPKESPKETFKEAPKEPKAKIDLPKPTVVSLRDIQEEELRIAKEKKAKQVKTPSAPTWVASSPVVSTTTTSNSASWSQPVVEKPLSLREIQEMEAKHAELNKKEAEPVAQTWVASSTKTATPVAPIASSAAGAAWTSATSTPKKTLREIQQEEELVMKKKNAKAVKEVQKAVVPVEGWTTVSHVRAPKPATPVAPAAAAPPVVKEPTKWEPVKSTSVRTSAPVVRGPSEDFRRWCRKALRGLNSGVNEDEILDMLLMFPMDSSTAEIIEDVIYANSLRIDGKRFAQEFMRRRKADSAGRLDIVTAGLEEEDDDDFKVVTKKNKKKASA